MTNAMISRDLRVLHAEDGPMYIPGQGETLQDRFVITWLSPDGIVFGTDYNWQDSDYLTAWEDGGWCDIEESGNPDPFNPGRHKILAVFWANN